MPMVWQDYANLAIRRLYPKSRLEVDYLWAKPSEASPQAMLVDSYGMDQALIQTVAEDLLDRDPYAAYSTEDEGDGGEIDPGPGPDEPLTVTGVQQTRKTTQTSAVVVVPLPGVRTVTGAQTTKKTTQTSSITVTGSGAPFIPNETNVGYLPAMGTLTNSTGPLTTSSHGQIVELKHFLAGHYIRVQHNNVTIRKCVVDADDFFSIQINSGTGTIIEDTTINGGTNGISGGSMTVQRCKIRMCENSVNVAGNNVTIRDNWMGDMPDPDVGGGDVLHLDGIQVDGAVNTILIQNNTIEDDWDNTSSVMLDNAYGALSNVQVLDNRLSGGSYSIYVDNHFTGDNITNIVITGNKFTWPGVFGYGSISASARDNVVWSGNVDNAGANIPKP